MEILEIPYRNCDEGALDYAVRLSDLYTKFNDVKERKRKGQFFTPKRVSTFMASLFSINQDNIRLLDPGAGVGTLSAAFCDKVAKSPDRIKTTIDAYESDPDLLPFLRRVLETCREELEERGHIMSYNIFEQDFVLHNGNYLEDRLFVNSETNVFYDCVISNPPYYRLHRNSPQASVIRKFISGHPNIYAIFMALSAKMLRANGEMVFITPRSFCSGFYYKDFREWFLRTVRIMHIHIFESRKDVFDKDGVLQENIIVKARKSEIETLGMRVSTSKTKSMKKVSGINATNRDVIFHRNGNTFIRIPTSRHDIRILRFIDGLTNTFKDLGFEISTGPVVPFRTRQNLSHKSSTEDIAPLLWMHNLRNLKITWPQKKNNKPIAIEINENTKSILLPVRNYVLVKRFSSKENRKRIHASVLLKRDFLHDFIGIENHVNYIYRIDGELTIPETFGIAGLLNTTFIDNYFRLLSGNTQVNATDLRSLPLPDTKKIIELGNIICKKETHEIDFDKVVGQVFQVDRELKDTLLKTDSSHQ